MIYIITIVNDLMHNSRQIYNSSLEIMKVLVVFLHGSGGSGFELSQFLNSLPVSSLNNKTFHEHLNSDSSSIRYDILTPTADARSYTPGFGELMNVWFDRSSNYAQLGRKDDEDDGGIHTSLSKV